MKRTRASLVAVATTAWIACAAPACSPTDVTLAILPTEQEAGPPLRCETSLDCGGLHCEKATCDAPSGTCELFPPDCDDDEDPFCGCDGITYFDDCLRKANDVASSSQGACSLNAAVTCAGPESRACPEGGTVCGQLGKLEPAVCAPNAEGICWLVPAQCPSPGVNLWDSCLQDGPRCVDTCTALHDGGAYLRSSTCHPRDD